MECHLAEVTPDIAENAKYWRTKSVGRPIHTKAYLSVPMITNRALERAKLMAQAITTAGYELASPWVIGSIEEADQKAVNVFQRDKKGAETADVIVADVSAPSTGVGMEIMAAYVANKRIILVAKRGSLHSRMLSHMDRKELIEFDDERELAGRLSDALTRDRT